MYHNPHHNPHHNPCHHPHHSPCQYPYAGTPGMYGMPGMHMDMYEDRRRLMEMYPDIHRRIYPRVQEVCQHMDVMSNPRMYPYVDPTLMDEMIQQVYEIEARDATTQQRGYLRDLISILFIRELLGRRRRYYTGYPYGGAFPGYGYIGTPGVPGFF